MIMIHRRHRSSPTSVSAVAMAAQVALLAAFVPLAYRADVDLAPVTLPRSLVRDAIPRGAAIVSIDLSGSIRVSAGITASTPVASVDDVARFAAAVVGQDPARPFVIKADRDARCGLVERVIAALQASHARSIYLLSDPRTLDDEEA